MYLEEGSQGRRAIFADRARLNQIGKPVALQKKLKRRSPQLWSPQPWSHGPKSKRHPDSRIWQWKFQVFRKALEVKEQNQNQAQEIRPQW